MKKLILCLFLAGCSAGVQPTLDFGIADASSDGSSAPDAGDPDLGMDAGDPDLGTDEGVDAGDPDLGPPPDAGPPACLPMTDPPVTGVCGTDNACCAAPCRSDGTCPIPVSGGFCTCFYMACPAGATICAFDGTVCPCR